jgi:hypothetical protein
MSNKYEYTDEMIKEMKDTIGAGPVTDEMIEGFEKEFGHPRRSITAKLRKEGFEVPKKSGAPHVFDENESAALKQYLLDHSGEFTAEEIAANFANAKFTARQINGKALSLSMTEHVKPADKKVVPKTYTPEEEAKIKELQASGSSLEDIATALNKPVNSVRGKLLSMQLKAPQRDKKATKTDAYDGIETLAPTMTVAELAAHFDKTERGVKTVLTRRGIAAKDAPVKSK